MTFSRRSLLTMLGLAGLMPASMAFAKPTAFPWPKEPTSIFKTGVEARAGFIKWPNGRVECSLADEGKRAPMRLHLLDKMLEKLPDVDTLSMSLGMQQRLLEANVLTRLPVAPYPNWPNIGDVAYAYKGKPIVPMAWYDFEHVRSPLGTTTPGGEIALLVRRDYGFSNTGTIHRISDSPVQP